MCEQKQLKWKDIHFETHKVKNEEIEMVKISVRKETSKVRKAREFYVRDMEYFDNLFKLTTPTHTKKPFC